MSATWLLYRDAEAFAYTAYVAMCAGMTAVASLTLAWMLYAWRTPEGLDGTRFVTASDPARFSFSLIVPARHEELVLGTTLSRLASMDHPSFEIVTVVGHDDPGTRRVAETIARRHGDRVTVVVDGNWPKNKPTALNTALPHCRGDIIGVFDAEDDVSARLLRHVDACFQRTDADVVQGGTQLMNHHSSWYSVRNVLEYYFWFKSRLHLHGKHGFIPLGGNTIFVRADRLRAVGGWDPNCLAEDCDLGTRLSSMGARVVVAYDSDLATREETPNSLRGLMRQRTRWNQGYLQVLRKRDWRRLPLRKRLLAMYTLGFPFVQAAMGVLVPVSLAMVIFVELPILLALASYAPLVPLLAILAMEVIGLVEFCREYRLRIRPRDYMRLVGGSLPYQLVLSFSAVRAVVREMKGARDWEKTAHAGVHLA